MLREKATDRYRGLVASEQKALHGHPLTSKSTHPYQRERASITGLRLALGKIM